MEESLANMGEQNQCLPVAERRALISGPTSALFSVFSTSLDTTNKCQSTAYLSSCIRTTGATQSMCESGISNVSKLSNQNVNVIVFEVGRAVETRFGRVRTELEPRCACLRACWGPSSSSTSDQDVPNQEWEQPSEQGEHTPPRCLLSFPFPCQISAEPDLAPNFESPPQTQLLCILISASQWQSVDCTYLGACSRPGHVLYNLAQPDLPPDFIFPPHHSDFQPLAPPLSSGAAASSLASRSQLNILQQLQTPGGATLLGMVLALR
jgi:hypothetical protein